MKQNMLVYKFLPLLLLTVFPSIAQALDYTYTTNNGAITITGYTGPGGDVSIPSEINGLSVISIETDVFYGCANLTSIIIPDSIGFIGFSNPFNQCTSLTNIILGSGVTFIQWPMGEQSLTAITVDEDNAAYSSDNGIVFNKDQTALIQYPAGKVSSSYAIPSSVTTIRESAFYRCTSLSQITIPSGVTTIWDWAFADSSLTNIIIPDTVTSIGHWVFGFSDSLNGVYFRGNAPSLDSRNGGVLFLFPQPFEYSTNVIVYYLPETMGWGATFGERPTAVWKPRIEANDESFGTSTNQFGFNISWASGQEIVVESNASLTNSAWQPLQTNTLSSDSLYFSDTQWTNYPSRFYRISSP